jgi:hypothetical protein
MIFELELKNIGEGDESLFNLYPQLNDNEGNLAITVDGQGLWGSRGYSNVMKEAAHKKTLTIKMGPRMFINPASKLL